MPGPVINRTNRGRGAAIFALILALLVAGYGAFRFFSERNRDRLDDPEGGYI